MPCTDPNLPRRDTVLAATFYLITKYVQAPCPIVGRAVSDHLSLLARFPAEDGDGSQLSASLHRLASAWDAIASGAAAGFAAREGAEKLYAYLQ
jgi:hypothetical protein